MIQTQHSLMGKLDESGMKGEGKAYFILSLPKA